MSESPADDYEKIYDDIRARVSERFEMRTQFAGHLGAYLVVSLFVWGYWIYPFNPQGTLETIGAVAMGLWTIGVVVHGVNWLLYEIRERVIQRELERAGLDYAPAKRKPAERLVRLSEDGELLDLPPKEHPAESRSARRESAGRD